MVRNTYNGSIYFLIILLLLAICSCDKELLEPEGNRRLKRIVDMKGFVKEEWNYNKKGQIESIKSYLRTPFHYYVEDENSDGMADMKEGMLNENPKLLTYTYENDKLKEVAAVRKPTSCSCSSAPSTSVYKMSYLDDKLNKINITVDYSYFISESELEVTYAPDYSFIQVKVEEWVYLLFYDDEKSNIIRREVYFQGELENLQHYTHDKRANPFFQKFLGSPISLEYWNKNNILTIREKNHYSGIMYHYYGNYPLSSRAWSPFADPEEWNFFYEYE